MVPRPGLLVLVIGASGVGKDTLLNGALAALAHRRDIVFPRREITRPAEAGGEAHLPVDRRTFTERRAAGRYALAWEAHGLGYGIDLAVEADLAAGRQVVVNVSRTVLDKARRHFPRVRVVQVVASPAVVRDRLLARGREDADDVARRLARASAIPVEGDDVVTVCNDSGTAEGVQRFLAALGQPAHR